MEVGWRRGKIVVIGLAAPNRFGHPMFDCVCDCGRRVTVSKYHLAEKISCGCFRRPRSHGFGVGDKSKRPPEYGVWCDMRRRCNSPNNQAYPRYGGRGIFVCERWSDFGAFYSDMGSRPSPAHEIDRIDNSGPYSPENCRWVTVSENGSNKRNNVLLTHDGRTQTMAQWSREVGITEKQLRARIKLGWSHSDALTKPLKRDRRRAA